MRRFERMSSRSSTVLKTALAAGVGGCSSSAWLAMGIG